LRPRTRGKCADDSPARDYAIVADNYLSSKFFDYLHGCLEEGRAFLAALLMQLSDTQIRTLFDTTRDDLRLR
jgi:hypothetical protein